MAQPPGTLTRERLLNAAEELFARRGFSGVSLREIVGSAQVNIAAAHYHFGSKEQLFEAAFSRAAEPVKEETLAMLSASRVHAGKPRHLEEVVRALVFPNFMAGIQRRAKAYSKMRAFLFLEDRAFAHKLFKRFYTEVSASSVAGLQSAVPKLSTSEMAWRLHVLIATLVFTTTPAGRLHPFARQSYRPDDAEEAIRFLVPLLVAVFRASPISNTRSRTRRTRSR